MPEDPNFGDVDDAQLEAAMAALLKTSSRPSPVDELWLPDADSGEDVEPDLAISPWAAVAADTTGSSLALDDVVFGGPSPEMLGDLGGLQAEPFASPAPPVEPSFSDLPRPAAPNHSRPWKGGVWAHRRSELVPGFVVACLVILGLAAVVITMTRDDGSGSKVSLSTPTSAAPTTTFAFDTIPPPPAPLPAEVVAPTDSSPPAAGPRLAPRKFRAPAKKVAAPARSPAAASGPAPAPAPAAGSPTPTPAPTPSTPSTPPPSTPPPATSPPTTTPATTSPPTTEPRDSCDLIDDPVRQQLCRDRTGD